MKMAAKKNKPKKPSVNKGVDIWQFDLPTEILQLLRSKRRSKRSPVHDASNYTCTTKWWVPESTRCNRSGERRWPELHLLCNSSNKSRAFTLQTYYAGNHAVENAATDGRQITVYCSRERAWMRYECTDIDPFSTKKKRIEFTSIIESQGKFYALSLQGALAVIERVDSRLTITGISTKRAVPSISSTRLFKEYLNEMNGEIFLVFCIHKKTLEIVDQVEVFRLCLVELKWIKIENLGGMTMFLDRRCS